MILCITALYVYIDGSLRRRKCDHAEDLSHRALARRRRAYSRRSSSQVRMSSEEDECDEPVAPGPLIDMILGYDGDDMS